MSGLKVLNPITLTDAMLLSSSLAEADYPAWVSGTAYAANARVIRTQTHSIYQAAVAVTSATAPESDPINWVRVGPTNRWAMFDNSVNTRSSSPSAELSVKIKPGRCNGLALINVAAASWARLECIYPRAVVAGLATLVEVEDYAYNIKLTRTTNYAAGTISLKFDITLENRNVSDWKGFFVEPYTILTDVFVGFASRSDMEITLTMPAGAQLGAWLVGNYIELGDVGYGVSSGIDDYSVKSTDEFGVTTLIERDFAKRVNFPVTVENFYMRRSFSTLAALRAKPALFVGSDDYRYSPFTVFGYVSNFDVALSFATYSIINVEVKGLT